LLWYQDQLTALSSPLGKDLPFDQANPKVIAGIQKDIADLVRAHNTLAQEQQKLESQMGSEKKQMELSQQQQQESQARFEFVQSLFDPAEARVFTQRQNVIIAAQGFYFPPGKSEIDAVNFPLLNKIVQAIKKFPDSRISVEGHTDSTGSSELNMKLSEERAAKVAAFLVEVGGVDATRISSQGFGEERPVASNETKEGRTINRRIEIQIINN
jgi:outer membrane protein OmpA-like peptidoglycan-associated protein